MVFDLQGKVAIVTGAASGIGLEITKEFLRNGCKAITLVDINYEQGLKVVNELQKEFGQNSSIFVKADVAIFEEFEIAFKKTVEIFDNIDILANNAGIFNDSNWSKEIAINLTGTTNGMILAYDTYLPKYKQDQEGLIINIASVAGLDAGPSNPVYAATKSALITLTRCWSHSYHYEHNKIKVIAICPGATNTPIIIGVDFTRTTLGERYSNWIKKRLPAKPHQSPQHVAKEMVFISKTCGNGTVWVIDNEQPYQYIFPGRTTMKENVLK